MMNSYENAFMKKIEHFKEYPNYQNLKTNADWLNGKNELQWRPEDIDMIGKNRKNRFKNISEINS